MLTLSKYCPMEGHVCCVFLDIGPPEVCNLRHIWEKSLPCSDEFSLSLFFKLGCLKSVSIYICFVFGPWLFHTDLFLSWSEIVFLFVSCSKFVFYPTLATLHPQALCCHRFFFLSWKHPLWSSMYFLKISQFTVSQNVKRIWVWAFFSHCLGFPMGLFHFETYILF